MKLICVRSHSIFGPASWMTITEPRTGKQERGPTLPPYRYTINAGEMRTEPSKAAAGILIASGCWMKWKTKEDVQAEALRRGVAETASRAACE